MQSGHGLSFAGSAMMTVNTHAAHTLGHPIGALPSFNFSTIHVRRCSALIGVLHLMQLGRAFGVSISAQFFDVSAGRVEIRALRSSPSTSASASGSMGSTGIGNGSAAGGC